MFFFFNDTATPEIYTLSLHDALPISLAQLALRLGEPGSVGAVDADQAERAGADAEHGAGDQHRRGLHVGGEHPRSEEHTSELQSRQYLVCRLLLEKKKHTPTSRE